MKIKEIAFTCYPVTDMARARAFYEQVLGLKPAQVYGDGAKGWVEYDISGGTLAIGSGAPEWKPASGGCCAGLEVDDFEGAIANLRSAGVTLRGDPIETPVCWMAIVPDPEGNSVIIHKRK